MRAGDHELALRARAGRFDEKHIERILPVGGIGAEIGKVAQILRAGRGAMMLIRIDMAIERRNAPGAEFVTQRIEDGAAGETQD